MTASVGLLGLMVGIALAVTALTPVILLILWIKDWLQGRLW